ncbi:MAG: GAF domain-containing protein [Proteobacteria bacterium]|nr:GAF domain-containing protein [Pseudomonadota bacterium]
MADAREALDHLSPEAIDALELGVVQLDLQGRILLWNEAQARLSGVDPADALARNFFREVAPETHRPEFLGRFLEGVRRGDLDEAFRFTLSGGPRPTHVAVRMFEARAPGRHWVTVQALSWPEPRGRGGAAYAVSRRALAEGDLDLDVCAREPIHIPGAVQPHAALLAFDAGTRRTVVCSANVTDVLGWEAEALLGRPIEAVLPADLVARIDAAAAAGRLPASAPLRCETAIGEDQAPFIALAHARGDRWIVELEPAPIRGEDFGAPSLSVLAEAFTQLREAPDLQGVASRAAELIRELTAFERVLIYRFDRDWNGEAIAEARDPDAYDSLLGLRFPASDIPAQARALYVEAPSRFVMDRDYVPAPLIGDPEAGNAPLDLSFAAARSLSPIHLEYQRNLGVNGSMSASIVVDGRLWGLVIGHHRRPHYLAPDTRAAASSLSEALGTRIGQLTMTQRWHEQERRMGVETALLERMAGGDDLADALLGGRPTLLDLFDATGAAIVDGDTATVAGVTPPPAAVLELAAWLTAAQPGRAAAYEQLSRDFPPAERYRAEASGLLAAFTAEDRGRLLLWFKPEEVSTVAWGGDPNKVVVVEAGAAGVLPRRSFERWVEERRGASTPWPEWQAKVAARIAGAVEAVALRQNRRIAALNLQQDALVVALADKESLLAQKDLLTREIDHRVKNSLQIVGSFVQMQARLAKDPASREAFGETYGRVMSVARIHDALYRSEDVGDVDVGQTIESLCRDLAGMVGEGQTLEVKTAPGIRLPYQQALAFSLIATELVTNALKYAYAPEEPGAVEVDVRAQPDRNVCLTVSDHGRGLPDDWASGARQSGLGMKLIRAMLSQVDGEMRVENGPGARFVVCA